MTQMQPQTDRRSFMRKAALIGGLSALGISGTGTAGAQITDEATVISAEASNGTPEDPITLQQEVNLGVATAKATFKADDVSEPEIDVTTSSDNTEARFTVTANDGTTVAEATVDIATSINIDTSVNSSNLGLAFNIAVAGPQIATF